MKLRLGHLELFSDDPARTAQFYVDLLGARRVAEQGEGRFQWLGFGDADLEILIRPGAADRSENYGNSQVALVLYCDDLAQSRDILETRGLVFEGEDGAADCPTFRDPDGRWIQLVAHDEEKGD